MTVSENDRHEQESLDEREARELLESPGFSRIENVPYFRTPQGKLMSGHASLAMVLNFYGFNRTPGFEDVPDGYPMTPEGILSYLLRQDGESAGTESEPYPLGLVDIANLTQELTEDRLVPRILRPSDYQAYGRERSEVVERLDFEAATEQVAFHFMNLSVRDGVPVIMRPNGYPQVLVGVNKKFPTYNGGTTEKYLFLDPISGERARDRYSIKDHWKGFGKRKADNASFNMLRIRRRSPQRRQGS